MEARPSTLHRDMNMDELFATSALLTVYYHN